jgi:hypothetical protein
VAIISDADRATIVVSAPGALVDVAQLTAVCASIRHAVTGETARLPVGHAICSAGGVGAGFSRPSARRP